MRFSSSQGRRLAGFALAVQMLWAVGSVPAFAQEGANTPRRGAPITLNFNNAEIESIARTMAVVTGRDVVVDPRVKGNMSLVTDRPVMPAVAFNQFAAALRLQNYAIVETDGLYKILPEAEAKLQSSAVATSTAGASGHQVITQVFKLNHESANNILPVLRPLIAPNNTINTNPGNNSLVITDYADNVRRLARIIAALDVPNASDVEVIPLHYSIASEIVPLIARLIEGGGMSAGAGTPVGLGDTSFKTTLLAEPRSNTLILRAANPVRAQLVRSLVEKLDRAPLNTNNGDAGNIYVVYLKNADAVRLATTLRAAMAGGNTAATAAISPAAMSATPPPGMVAMSGGTSQNTNQPSTGGQVQADPATNSLIITASEPQYRQLRAVIDRLDGKRAQVLVECLIVEVNADKAAEFGIQWQTVLGKNGDRNIGIIGNNSSLAGANIIDLSAGIASGNLASAHLSSGFNFGIGTKINGQYLLSFLARFLESNGEGNVLSTPNLLTLDNEEAKIVIGQNVPFVTGQYTNTGTATATVNPFQTIERKDVGLTLRVRPQINENNTVKMAIFQEVSTIQANTVNNPNGPTTNKRSIESNVMVEDGSVVVLGGLLQDEYSGSVDKIPLLGDIPIVGNLFRNEARSRKKTNLMVFLRPVVVRDPQAIDTIAYDRYDALRSLQKGTQPDQNMLLRGVSDAPVMPELWPKRQDTTDRRIEGTRLVPQPLSRIDVRPNANESLRGALPPTADPATRRELP